MAVVVGTSMQGNRSIHEKGCREGIAFFPQLIDHSLKIRKDSLRAQVMKSRRASLKLCSLGAVSYLAAVRAETEQRFPIGVCDWNLGMKQNIGAFEVGKEIGVEGLQVSFSTPGSDFDLRDREVRDQYYERVEDTGIRMASLGMGVLNQEPLATTPEAIGWVSDAIDTLASMQKENPAEAPKVCLLAFFGKGDINGKPELMAKVVEKLKTVAKKAEDAGVILGIESYLSATEHLRIIEGVGSEAIQVYYDSANSLAMGYDIYQEVVDLGAERICQVHCKERKSLIGDGEVDFEEFRDSLVEAGYRDWLIMEASRPQGMNAVEAYRSNLKKLNSIFNA